MAFKEEFDDNRPKDEEGCNGHATSLETSQVKALDQKNTCSRDQSCSRGEGTVKPGSPPAVKVKPALRHIMLPCV